MLFMPETSIPKLRATASRFNKACTAYRSAQLAWKANDSEKYEEDLRSAAMDCVGSLEWALKIYLRFFARARILPEDQPNLKQPTFNQLIILLEKYAIPTVPSTDVSLLYEYRDLLRNAAEHDAAIPSRDELEAAIKHIRRFMITYLSLSQDQLDDCCAPLEKMEKEREEYRSMLAASLEYMDLGGISPRVGSRIVKIRMNDLFVPLHAIESSVISEVISEEKMESEAAEENGASEQASVEIPNRSTRPVDFRKALQSPKLVVLGDPGSGKTTLGRFIAHALAAQTDDEILRAAQDRIPILTKAAEFAEALRIENDVSFMDFIVTKSTYRFGTLFSEAIKYGKAWIVIDGLDEIADQQLRVIAARHIERFVSEFSDNRFLITSRIVGYRQNRLGAEFSHVTLAEFDETQSREFLKQWYRAIEAETQQGTSEEKIKEQVEELWKSISEKAGILKLSANPLLLTIIALVNFRGTQLPSRRVELYQIATETLIENWPLKQRGLKLDSYEIKLILEPVAFHMFERESGTYISEHELRPLIEMQVGELHGVTAFEARQMSRELLETIEQHTGFFVEKGVDRFSRRVYGFLHQTFGEYLAARHLASKWAEGTLQLANFVHQSRWREVLLLMAGEVGTWTMGQASKLLQDILALGSEFETVLHRDLALTGEMLADNIRVKRELHDSIVQALITAAVESPHAEVFILHTRLLSKLVALFGQRDSLSLLALGFNMSDSPLRRTRKRLIRLLLGDDPRSGLRELVNDISTDDASREVFNGIDDLLPFVEYREVKVALGFDAGDERYVFGVKTPFHQDFLNMPGICRASDLFNDEKQRQVWILTAEEVSQLPVEGFVKLFTERDWNSRFLLMHALVVLDIRGTLVPRLESAMLSAETVESKARYFDILAFLIQVMALDLTDEQRIKYSHCMDVLLKQGDALTKTRAADFIGWITNQPEKKINALKYMLKSEDEEVRLRAITSRHRRETVAPEVLSIVHDLVRNDSSERVRAVAAALIAAKNEFNSDNRLNIFSALLSDEHPDDIPFVVEAAIALLASASADELQKLLPSLRAFLTQIAPQESEVGFPYWHFVWDDRKLTPRPEIADSVLSWLDDERVPIQRWALIIWNGFRARDSDVVRLLPILQNENASLRAFAVRALRSSDLRSEAVISTVLKALDDESRDVVNAVKGLIERVTQQWTAAQVVSFIGPRLNQNPADRVSFEIITSVLGDPLADPLQ